MRFRSAWGWGATLAGLLAVGAGAVAAASPSSWQVLTAGAGARLCAWAFEIGQRLPLALLIPVVAMSASFHAGSRIGHHVRRRRDAQVMVVARPPVARYAILFCLAALMGLVFLATRGLLG
ncbi:MAG: hypothetical protein HY321_04100 [Armatimonadetes bacterium]|nr:hypothetical protein [Armatimonadota bacterium]